MMFNFAILSLLILKEIRATSNNDDDLKCTQEFCEEYVNKFPCPPTSILCSNTSRSLIIPSPTVCNCCEHCFVFQEKNDHCMMGNPGQPLPNFMCGPGLECVEGFCKEKKTTDSDFFPGYECIEGKCFCAIIVNNTLLKLFGEFEETENIIKEKQCECSRFEYQARLVMKRVLPLPGMYLPTARCLPNGQYDPLQCIDDMCGCVDRATGTWNFSIKKVPIGAIGPGSPKCFNQKIHKINEYFKPCEKEKNEIMNEKLWSISENLDVIISHPVRCTPTGDYEKPRH